MNDQRETGTVVRFSVEKGYGFARCDSDKQQVFIHHTEIHMEGFRQLNEGQRVEFLRVPKPEKPCPLAIEVRIIEQGAN